MESTHRTSTDKESRRSRRLHQKLGPGNFYRIARRSKTSQQHVSRVLRGMRGVSLRVAARLADAAGVTIDELWEYIQSRDSYQDRGRRTLGDMRRGR